MKTGNSAEMKDSLAKQDLESLTNTPERFAASVLGEMSKNLELAKKIGLKPQ